MDVDKSIRILQKVCCDNYKNLSYQQKTSLVKEFLNINDKNKPIKYRGFKTENMLFQLFESINQKLRDAIKNDFGFQSNFQILEQINNNKVGADAIIVSENNFHHLEMKFGSETLANKGQLAMNKIFDLNNNSKFNFINMNKSIKDYQRSLIDNGIEKEEQLIKELEIHLQTIVKEIRSVNLVPNYNEINKLLNSTGQSNLDNLIKYTILPDDIQLNKQLDTSGEWYTKIVDIVPNSSRIQIIISNDILELKFLLNWKNNYEYPKGIKRSAKTGGTTSCWNVWVKKL